MARIDQAVLELYRHSYFDPQLPTAELGETEYCLGPHRLFRELSSTPYSPLDLCVGLAIAFWHSQRRLQAQQPVTTTRFPQPPTASSMAAWPKAGVPKPHLETLLQAGLPIEAIQGTQSPQLQQGSYPLFNTPIVQRRSPPLRPAHPSANALLTDTRLTVRPTDRNDVASGVLLQPGQELQINASGSIREGVVYPWNSPAGQTRLIDDALAAAHRARQRTGARVLLIRSSQRLFLLAHTCHGCVSSTTSRGSFLRINDAGLGDGVAPSKSGSASGASKARHRQPAMKSCEWRNLLTSDAVDRIEVTVMASAVPLTPSNSNYTRRPR